jgi:uncharacterized protein (TIGR02001 family)
MPLSMTTRAAALLAAALAAPALAQDSDSPDSSRLHFSADLTVTNQYFFRGILQEHEGFIAQPSAELGIDLIQNTDFTLTGIVGVWNSFHDQATGSTTDDDIVSKWYEFDFYAGVSATLGRFGLSATYTAYTSPNDAFSSIEELIFTLAYDDSGHFGAVSFQPYVTVAFETEGQADGGSGLGTFLAVGIEPNYTFESTPVGPVTLSLPLEAGFSLNDYYEGTDGDESFGYLSVGPAVNIDIDQPAGFGDWSLHAAATFLLLGDSAKEFNNEGDQEWILSAGIAVEF